jgi:hypothetical protein
VLSLSKTLPTQEAFLLFSFLLNKPLFFTRKKKGRKEERKDGKKAGKNEGKEKELSQSVFWKVGRSSLDFGINNSIRRVSKKSSIGLHVKVQIGLKDARKRKCRFIDNS